MDTRVPGSPPPKYWHGLGLGAVSKNNPKVLRFRVQGSGDQGFRVLGVQGLGFRVRGFRV